MGPTDRLLSTIELTARNLYWRSPAVQRWYERHRTTRPRPLPVSRTRLREHLRGLGLEQNRIVLVHSSVQSLRFLPEHGSAGTDSPLAVAAQLLTDLKALIGPTRTLVMPSHPHYPADPGFMNDKSALVLDYSPPNTPSRIGLLTELFRCSAGALRSDHPLSSVTALGPHAQELVTNNLNSEQPLPHGVHSAYYRVCKLGGLVVSIGVPLIKCLTVSHVAEEVRDSDWPIANFFYRRRFRVERAGKLEHWTVRERRPEFVRNLALLQLRRDLLCEHILRETWIDGLRVDTARSGDLYEFMMRHPHPTYPYMGLFGTRLDRRRDG